MFISPNGCPLAPFSPSAGIRTTTSTTSGSSASRFASISDRGVRHGSRRWHIVRACRAAGTVEPRWELEPGGLRLEFVFVGTASESIPGDAIRETGGSAREPGGTEPTRPESQPESQPESLAARVLRQLAEGPMSKSDLSRSLGQSSVSGQLNKVIRALLADGSIGYTREASKPTSDVPPDGRGTGGRRRTVRRKRRHRSVTGA